MFIYHLSNLVLKFNYATIMHHLFFYMIDLDCFFFHGQIMLYVLQEISRLMTINECIITMYNDDIDWIAQP